MNNTGTKESSIMK